MVCTQESPGAAIRSQGYERAYVVRLAVSKDGSSFANEKRLHSSIDYLSPIQSKQSATLQAAQISGIQCRIGEQFHLSTR